MINTGVRPLDRSDERTHERVEGSSPRNMWSAVGSMALTVALLIAAEFMPVSLLTPIASDLHATAGMAVRRSRSQVFLQSLPASSSLPSRRGLTAVTF
jgi:hypothetical protein